MRVANDNELLAMHKEALRRAHDPLIAFILGASAGLLLAMCWPFH